MAVTHPAAHDAHHTSGDQAHGTSSRQTQHDAAGHAASGHSSPGQPEAGCPEPDHPDHTEPLTVDAAYARSHEAALRESEVGEVGLEIETHLVDLDHICDPVDWDRAGALPEALQKAAGRSKITLEPGGQLELSGP